MSRRARIMSAQEFRATQKKFPDWHIGETYIEFKRNVLKQRGYKETTINRLLMGAKKKKSSTSRKVSRETSGISVTEYQGWMPHQIRENLRTGIYSEKQLQLLYRELYRKQSGRNLALKKAGYEKVELMKPSLVKTKRQLIFELATAVKRTTGKYSTVKGAREFDERTMRTLNNEYENLNLKTTEDLRMFGEFMQSVRTFMGDVIYDSDRAVEMYNNYTTNNTSISDLFSEYKNRMIDRRR